MKIVLFFSILLTMLAANFLFRVKHQVLSIEQKIKHLNHSIIAIQSDTNLLLSEWTYLTQPKRIGTLGKQYLGHFKTLQPRQLVPNPVSRQEHR
jgi:hypothetical protein